MSDLAMRVGDVIRSRSWQHVTPSAEFRYGVGRGTTCAPGWTRWGGFQKSRLPPKPLEKPPSPRHQSMMGEALSAICVSVSVPRPQWVEGVELLTSITEPDIADPQKRSLAESIFTEVSTFRVAQLVREGHLTWRALANAAQVYELGDTETATLARDMIEAV